MYRRILILCCCVLCVALTQAGCFGVIVMSPQDCDRSADSTSLPGAINTPTTKKEVREYWGKPDEIITVSENEEAWIYSKKDLWCGVIPVFILPVPITLPLCNGFDRIEFRGNEAARLHSKEEYGFGFFFGITPYGPGGAVIGQEDFPCGDNMFSGPKYSKPDKFPETAGLVYLYRQHQQEFIVKSYIIKTDNKVIAPLYSGGYYPYFSTPGKREFSATYEAGTTYTQWEGTSITLDIKSGQTYYIKAEDRPGPNGPHLVIVAPEVAEKEIADCTRKMKLRTAK
jgi:hypothetical protein